jgi:hypothetical protein
MFAKGGAWTSGEEVELCGRSPRHREVEGGERGKDEGGKNPAKKKGQYCKSKLPFEKEEAEMEEQGIEPWTSCKCESVL